MHTQAARSLRFTAGFTLVELIMVIVLLGVLAVFAAPGLLNSSDYGARGFHDQTLAYLRFAQKTAIAQRRTVCVTSTSNTLSLGIANAAAINSCDITFPLRGPRGESPALLKAPGSATYSTQPGSFNFDGLGQPVDPASGVALVAARTIVVSGASGTITVEPITGYVHE